ncbi:MAG: hypothetical protein ACC657_00345 [Thiohalomonadales bacterium]
MYYITHLYVKLFVVVTTLFFLVSSCSEISTEQQVEAQIKNMQQAISDKSLSDFMDYFTKDFIGNKTLTRDDLRRLIFFHFRRNRNIETYKWQADIKVEKEIVKVDIYVIVSGSNKVLPERGRIYTINSSWKKKDGSWLIVKASWKDTLLD